jgi:hypothetical protein
MSDEALKIDIDKEDATTEDPPEATESPQGDPPRGPQEPPPVTFTDEQQAKFNSEIGKKVGKQREAERERDEERARAAAAEQELAALKAPQRPEIPPTPDPYDDDYEGKMKVRDDALVQTAQYDAQANAYQAQEQALQQQKAADASRALVESVTAYSDRADKLGITTQQLQQAGNTVAKYGIGNEVAQYILGEEHGPDITMYLSENPLEMEAMRQMSPMRASVYIENTVKDKAIAARPTPTPGPAPINNPSGAGMPEGDRGPSGAIYE